MSRPVWQRFESVLADPITRYLAAKRSMGCRFNTEDRALRLLDRYLTDQGVQRIDDVTSGCLEAFLASRVRTTGTSYNNLLGVVRRLFEWMIDQQELASSPLTAQSRPHSARRLPYLYDPATIHRILDYAAELPDGSRAPQRGPTYATIFALLAGLGLRIGEVSRLQCGDVDLQRDVLLVRNSKFGKSRLVPFGPRLAARLRSYATLREQRLGVPVPEAPFFTWNGDPRLRRTHSTRSATTWCHGSRSTRPSARERLRTWVAALVRGSNAIAVVSRRHRSTGTAQPPFDLPRPRWPAQHRRVPHDYERAPRGGHRGVREPRGPGGAAMSSLTVGTVVHDFFVDYLLQKGLCQSSVRSYRDTLRVFSVRRGTVHAGPSAEFSSRISVSSGYSHFCGTWSRTVIHRPTRNQRLAALRTFFEYLGGRSPEALSRLRASRRHSDQAHATARHAVHRARPG